MADHFPQCNARVSKINKSYICKGTECVIYLDSGTLYMTNV